MNNENLKDVYEKQNKKKVSRLSKNIGKAFIAVATVFPKIRYAIKVIIAISITAGTKYPLTVSATFAIGALVLVASITSLTISEIVDSFPIFSASYSIYPS